MSSGQKKIIDAGDMSGPLVSSVIDLDDVKLGSIQSVFSGAPAGDLALELSNDIVAPGGDPDVAVTNWTSYTGSVYTVAAAGTYMHNISNMGYKWLRLTWTPSGGAGTLDATAAVKHE
jgi:hypothetical protein